MCMCMLDHQLIPGRVVATAVATGSTTTIATAIGRVAIAATIATTAVAATAVTTAAITSTTTAAAVATAAAHVNTV